MLLEDQITGIRPRISEARIEPGFTGGSASLLAFDPYRGELVAADHAAVYRIGRLSRGTTERELVALLPPSVDRGQASLRGMVVLPDGSILVARLSRGESGGLFLINGRTVERIPGIAGHNLRAGLTYDARAQALYSATFHQVAGRIATGWLTRIDLINHRTTQVCAGFERPSAITRLGSHVLVADQARESLLLVDVRWTKPVPVELSVGVGNIEALTAAGTHTIYAATWNQLSRSGAILKIIPGGGASVLWRGESRIRSIATDARHVFACASDSPGIIVIPVQRPAS